MSTLTEREAKDLGRTLRFIRDARRMTLRGVETEGVSYQWVHNIEQGTKFDKKTGVTSVVNADVEVYRKLQRIYRLPDHTLEDFLLRARVRSALELRGISRGDTDATWKMMETRLGELGTPLNTDLARIVGVILGQPEEVRVR